jgi:hypothetical protein
MNSHLLDTPHVDVVSDQLCIPISWAKAEALQTHLRRTGIRTTVHLDTPVRTAWLEVWPGPERGLVETALGKWKRRSLV